MRPFVALVGWVLAASPIAFSQEKDKSSSDSPKEQEVVAYDSKTHGAVQVKSASKDPGDWFNILKDGRIVKGSPTLLDGKEELEPGTYVIRVNRTERKVIIEAGKMTIVWTGDLMVESKRNGYYWVPKQGKETRLVSNPPVVNTRVALFPGTYDVHVQVDGSGVNDMKHLGKAEVKAGKKTVIKH
jgi:hypothetical protein